MGTTVYKQLATIQDLALGTGKVIQQRNGKSVELDKINMTSYISTIADLRAIDYALENGQVINLLSRATPGDGGAGKVYWSSVDLSTEVSADTQSGLYIAPNSDLTGASGAFVRLWNDVGDARWFGMTSTGDQAIPLQAAITAICGLSKSLYIFPGAHTISVPMTFPDTGWTIFGDAATTTGISEVGGSGQITLFDLSGLGGPSCTVKNLAFDGPITGGLGGIGCYVNSSNGTVLQSCWFRGLTNGIQKTVNSSFLSVLDCVFEFNFGALNMTDGVQCVVKDNTFYQNSYDYYFAGDFSAGVFDGATFIETKTACMYFDGVIDGTFTNMSCRQDFDTQLPVILDIRGASKRNQIENLRTKSFGSYFVKMSAEANTDNKFVNCSAILIPHIPPALAPPVGTLVNPVEIGVGSDNNIFSGLSIYGVQYGIVNSADNNKFIDSVIDSTTVNGVLLSNADNSSFTNVEFRNNTLDWAISGTVPTVWVQGCETTGAGLTPIRLGSLGIGIYGRTFYTSAMPSTGAYITNDFASNITRTIDASSMILYGWHRATTGSNHVINVDWIPLYVSTVSPAI